VSAVAGLNGISYTSVSNGYVTISRQSTQTIPIGTAMSGGYLAGRISIGGQTYRLIVSPKTAEVARQMRTTFTGVSGASTSVNDGYTSTQAIYTADPTNNIAAAYARTLNLNGFTDWYIPSRDELEIMFRNLNPSFSSNQTAIRQDDSLGTGTNSNSVPTGAAYTTNNPTQTTVAQFRVGGDQALTHTGQPYWTSSRSLTQPAYMWNGSFVNGQQVWGSPPDQVLNVRPVRKELDT
jgi:hypothetical protein